MVEDPDQIHVKPKPAPLPSDRRDKIIAQNPLVGYLQARGYDLHAAGDNYISNACPVEAHGKPGHRPVSIDTQKQVWYCNDHKVGGSVIDWEATSKNISIAEAMNLLNGAQQSDKQFVCSYDYTDENGKVLFRKVRFKVPPPKLKTFELRKPNGTGGWTANIKGVRRVLYHLPAVIASQKVIIDEGEKDADNVAAFGFVTTTNFDGAKKWTTEYTKVLRGKDVVLIPDNDADGKEHAAIVIRALAGNVKSLRRVTLPEGFKDISDYLASLPEVDRRSTLQKLIEEAPEASDDSPSPAVVRFTHEELMAFVGTQDPNTLLGDRWLCRGFTSLFAGPAGAGKSTLEMQMAICFGCGQSFYGIRPVRALRSLILQAENDLGDSAEQYQGVLDGMLKHSGDGFTIDAEKVARNVQVNWVIGKSGFDFCGILDGMIKMHKPDVVWIDPLFAFAGCDLMKPKETTEFIRHGLVPIAINNGVALFVVHHIGKSYRDNTEKQKWSDLDFQYLGFGTSEIQNAFRAVTILLPVSTEDSRDNLYRLVLSKRGGRAGARDSDGHRTTNLYLTQSKEGIFWEQADKPDKKPSPNQKWTGEDILDEMSVTAGRSAVAMQLHMKTECGMSEKTFYRHWKDLKKQGLIRLDSDENWIKNADHE